jgi:DNA-binding winged helix-turn-helix (wHTH) protein
MPTPQSSPAGRIVRFGVFEADLSAGELRKSGRRVRLQEQPFQILALLLERPGEVITREEVRQKLWAADTFVDFDHSLNTAIKKVREALGDSASSPRYVETMARRGYRFLAPVEWADGSTKAADAASGKPADIPAQSIDPELEVPLPRRGVTRALFGLIQIMYLAFYVVALFLLRYVYLVTESFLPGWGFAIQAAVVVTAGVGIPLRFYLLSSALFDYRRLGDKFLRMFPFILALDQLWAVAPFLTAQEIGFGAAFAATAALLYVPFAERTLVKMAYPRRV